jgi:prepilin-type processing-associated H-X9-DG protein
MPANTFPQLPNYVGIGGAAPRAGSAAGYAVPGTECRTGTTGGQGCCDSAGWQCANGIFHNNSKTSFASITDGSANVMMISEHSDYLIFTDNSKQALTGSGFHGWMIGAAGPRETPADNGGNNRHFSMAVIAWPINQKRGWSDNCSGTGICWNLGQNIPLNSTHPGGVNVGLADGSVQFFSDTTALAVLFRFAHRSDGQVARIN